MKKLTGTHHILMMDIESRLSANGGAAVVVHNPKTADLIAAGHLTETAPRSSATTGGLCVTSFTVALPVRA